MILRAGYHYCTGDGLFTSYRVGESRRVACGGGRGGRCGAFHYHAKQKWIIRVHTAWTSATIGIPAAVRVPTTE